jgi:hypothetical protein
MPSLNIPTTPYGGLAGPSMNIPKPTSPPGGSRGPSWDIARAEQGFIEKQIQQEAVRSGIQAEINQLDQQKQAAMDLASRWGKIKPGSQEQKDALGQATQLEKEIAKRRSAIANPQPETAIPSPAPAASAPALPDIQAKPGTFDQATIDQMTPTTRQAPPPSAPMPTLEQLQAPSRPPLDWKFGGQEGGWNQFNPDTGQSAALAGGEVVRPSMPDYIRPGIGGGAPSPTETAPIEADVTRGGGGFYMPKENDVAYLPQSVYDEASKRNQLAATRKSTEALQSTPPTIRLPKEIDPNQTEVPTQEFIDKILPAILNLNLSRDRYTTPERRVEDLLSSMNDFDSKIKALAEEAASKTSAIEDEAERARVAEQYRSEIDRLKNQQSQVASLLGVHKDVISGGGF